MDERSKHEKSKIKEMIKKAGRATKVAAISLFMFSPLISSEPTQQKMNHNQKNLER